MVISDSLHYLTTLNLYKGVLFVWVTVTEDLWKSSGPTFIFGPQLKTHYLWPKIALLESKNGKKYYWNGMSGFICLYPKDLEWSEGVGWYKINIWAKFHYWGLVKNGQKRPKVRVACSVEFAVLQSWMWI